MKKTVSEEIKPKRKRSKGYSRVKGHSYEIRIAKELRELGFTGIVTSRSESKRADDNKQDLIDTEQKLPLGIQLKCVQNTPSYFRIREESSINNEDFVLI